MSEEDDTPSVFVKTMMGETHSVKMSGTSSPSAQDDDSPKTFLFRPFLGHPRGPHRPLYCIGTCNICSLTFFILYHFIDMTWKNIFHRLFIRFSD